MLISGDNSWWIPIGPCRLLINMCMGFCRCWRPTCLTVYRARQRLSISVGVEVVILQIWLGHIPQCWLVSIKTVLANKPDDFVPLNRNLPNLEFGQVSPVVVITTIQSFETKASTDLEGIRSKLLIRIAVEIYNPRMHIFNLSIQTGVFPERLKTSRTVHICIQSWKKRSLW
jgi:hypothetical protein